MRLTVNLQALTLEQQLTKRRRLVVQMVDNIKQELRADLRTAKWQGLAELKEQDNKLNGHTHAQATLEKEMLAVSSERPEYYNDDEAWGGAIARAVSASSQVGAWPAALERLCKVLALEPTTLMQKSELVLRFRGLGQAEGEVVELLLKVSPVLRALTLHDGGLNGDLGESMWHQCVEAIARGVGAAPQLDTLNCRHFGLRGSAGSVMAQALSRNASLTALRLVNNGLDESALTSIVDGNERLRTLMVQDNPLHGAKLEALAVLIGSSRSLQSVGLPGCKLGPAAGHNLADALAFATSSRLPLFHLELQNNAFDADVGHALAAALQGNCRLTELTLGGNAFGDEAMAALRLTQESIRKQWLQTQEGRLAAKDHQRRSGKGSAGMSSFIGDLLSSIS